MLTAKPTENRPLRKSRHRCKDNIRIDLKIYVNTRNWFDSARVEVWESPCEYGIEPLAFISREVSIILILFVRYSY